jgi:hypothetical protein
MRIYSDRAYKSNIRMKLTATYRVLLYAFQRVLIVEHKKIFS